MITLYGSLHSRANRCAWMLKELGVTFDSVPTNFQTGGTREPAFLDMNPNGVTGTLTGVSLTVYGTAQ